MSLRSVAVAVTLVAPVALGGLPVRAQDPLAPTSTAAADPVADPLASAPAEAPSSDDVVELRNGGVLRGTILEVIPEDSLTIVSATTREQKSFPWSDVASYERNGERTDIAPRAEKKPAKPEPKELTTGPGVPRVHIESSRDVSLQMFQVTSEMVATGSAGTMVGIAYRPVCTAPCDQPVDGSQGHTFFIGGPGVTTSGRFSLTGYNGDLTAQVKPGRRGLRVGGLVLAAGIAPAVIVGGVTWMLVASLTATRQVYDIQTQMFVETRGTPDYAGPASLIAVGGALLVGGIVMAVLGKTKVKLVPRGLGLLRPLQF